MSHNVESMAYTNEVPWHGLGQHIKNGASVDQMIKAAKLDWTVERRPMFYTSSEFLERATDAKNKQSGIKTTITADKYVGDDFAALVRVKEGDVMDVLDVVGSRYQPRQNAEVFEMFNEYVKAGKATMETAGSLRGGRIVWGLANLNASFTLKGNDQVKGYLLLASFHQQGKANVYKLTATRVVCNNTLSIALNGAGASFRDHHAVKLDANIIARAKEVLGLARDEFAQFGEVAKQLQAVKLKRPDIIRVLAPIYQPEICDTLGTQLPILDKDFDFERDANKTFKIVMDVLVKAPGAQPDNAWGVLNAVTYYADHVASRTADKRLTNAWLGKTALQKDAVLEALKVLV